MSDPYYKEGKHLSEWENADLTIYELGLKLEAATEERDYDQIKLVAREIMKRELVTQEIARQKRGEL